MFDVPREAFVLKVSYGCVLPTTSLVNTHYHYWRVSYVSPLGTCSLNHTILESISFLLSWAYACRCRIYIPSPYFTSIGIISLLFIHLFFKVLITDKVMALKPNLFLIPVWGLCSNILLRLYWIIVIRDNALRFLSHSVFTFWYCWSARFFWSDIILLRVLQCLCFYDSCFLYVYTLLISECFP